MGGAAAERFLSLEGAANVRDLGGLPIEGGGKTRRGRILRSDLIVRLGPGDEAALIDRFGLRTVVDLRRPQERRDHPGPWERHGVRIVNAPLPLDPDFAAERNEDMVELYLDFLEPPATAMTKALTTVAATKEPLLVHCAAGKDRTGVLVALLLEIIGVGRETVTRDYVLTHARMPAVAARLEAEAGRTPRHPPGVIYGADARTLETFFSGLDERFGGSREWALSQGVEAALLDAFAASMHEPTN
jgi:protein-tyrosine phosphatase